MMSFDVDWRGLILPVAYLLVLSGTFATFSTVYRKRKAAQSASLAPWFPPHLQRNIYLSLQQLEPEPGAEKTDVKVPDSLLRAALLRRAVEDIRRIVQIRTGKQACATLLQRGSVGDDLWQRFLRAEKEMEEELRDVVLEANTLVPNWGTVIFQTANAIAGNEALRAKLDPIQAKAETEKAWWAKRRASIAKSLMEEEGVPPATATTTAATNAPATPAAPIAAAATKERTAPPAAAKVSDDDAVLVDAATTPAKAATPSGGKKKKGKK